MINIKHNISFDSPCFVELLGAVPKKLESYSNASFSLRFEDFPTVYTGECVYKTIPVGWERKPDSSSPPRPAFFICSVNLISLF
jgi:hypothetical protein